MKPLTQNTSHVIIMVGIPGSGKTTFAEHFANTFHAPYINPRDISDVAGIDAKATEKVTKLLFEELLKTNHTLIYEGSTYSRVQRLTLERMVTKAGYKALIVWVQTDPTESKHRATKKQKGSHNLNATEFDAAYKLFQNPAESEKAVVISGKHTYPTQLKAVLKRLVKTDHVNIPPSPEQPRRVSGRNIIIR